MRDEDIIIVFSLVEDGKKYRQRFSDIKFGEIFTNEEHDEIEDHKTYEI